MRSVPSCRSAEERQSRLPFVLRFFCATSSARSLDTLSRVRFFAHVYPEHFVKWLLSLSGLGLVITVPQSRQYTLPSETFFCVKRFQISLGGRPPGIAASYRRHVSASVAVDVAFHSPSISLLLGEARQRTVTTCSVFPIS
jgi:hypothetical protein